MRWIAFLLIVVGGTLGGTLAHTQEKEATIFEMQRDLTFLDKKIETLTQQQATLSAMFEAIPAGQEIGKYQYSPELFKKEKELKDSIEKFNKSKTEKQNMKVGAIDNCIKAFTDQVRLELRNLQSKKWKPFPSGAEPLLVEKFYEIIAKYETILQSINSQIYEVDKFQGVPSTEITKGVQSLSVNVSKLMESLKAAPNELSRTLASAKDQIKGEIDKLQKDLNDARSRQGSLVKAIGSRQEGQLRINERLVTWSIPAFAAALVLLLLIPKFYHESVQQIILESGLILELITVFLLTATILLLGFAGKMSAEVLGTLIGGIAGYVLGRWKRREKEEHSTQSKNP